MSVLLSVYFLYSVAQTKLEEPVKEYPPWDQASRP